MRKHTGSPPEVTYQQNEGVITQIREYELITPLFGGGVVAGKTDPITAIRGSEIRGHLRFWWRACRGGKFNGNLTDMKKAEDTLWGATSTKQGGGPSQVHIQVETHKLSADAQKAPFFLTRDGKVRPQENVAPAYAAFPLQPSDEDIHTGAPLKTVCIDVSFTLTISFPAAQQQEIEAALWAWETFGGIGARTRRGFGALSCIDIKENEQTLEIDLPQADQGQTRRWIEEKLNKHVAGELWASSVPHLKHQGMVFKVVNSSDAGDSWVVWDYLIKRLSSFRQNRQPSRNPRQPGRSEWPEPSEIREITGQSLPAHRSSIPYPPIHKFPRAAFGLPIIFQFKERDRYNHDNPVRDPRKTVLQLKTSERLASPLILKPLACKDGAYIGLAVILEGTGVDEDQLILKTQQGTPVQRPVKSSFAPGESLVVGEDNSGVTISIDSRTNALQAFLRYL